MLYIYPWPGAWAGAGLAGLAGLAWAGAGLAGLGLGLGWGWPGWAGLG